MEGVLSVGGPELKFQSGAGKSLKHSVIQEDLNGDRDVVTPVCLMDTQSSLDCCSFLILQCGPS